MNETHGYWIHAKVYRPESFKGFFYTQSCHCSVCGYHSNIETKTCSSCKSIMDQEMPKEKYPQTRRDENTIDIEQIKRKLAELTNLTPAEVRFLYDILKSYQD